MADELEIGSRPTPYDDTAANAGGVAAMIRALAPHLVPEWAHNQYVPPEITPDTPPSKVGPGEQTLPQLAGQAAIDVGSGLAGLGAKVGAKVVGGGLAKAIFAGPMAQNADLNALEKARGMAYELMHRVKLNNMGDTAQERGLIHGLLNTKTYKETGWYRDADGKWRTPLISDKTPSSIFWPRATELGYTDLRKRGEAPLQKMLDLPQLYEAYPDFKKVPVFASTDPTSVASWRGFGPHKGMNLSVTNLDMHSRLGRLQTLGHEVQHGIQDIEDYARGSNVPYNVMMARSALREEGVDLDAAPDSLHNKISQAAYAAYHQHAGEQEARRAGGRVGLRAIGHQELPKPWEAHGTSGEGLPVDAPHRIINKHWLKEQSPETQEYVRWLRGY